MYINSKAEKLPYGIAAEIFKVKFFKKVKARNQEEKEHVTLKFKKKKNLKRTRLHFITMAKSITVN